MRVAPLVSALLLLSTATLAQRPRLSFVDLSESGRALQLRLVDAGAPATRSNPITVTFGTSAAWDVLDFEVRGAEVGKPLVFRIPRTPLALATVAPQLSIGDFSWKPASTWMDEAELWFEIVPPRERFLVRLMPRSTELDAAYYPYGRHVAFMETIAANPLAQVTLVGTSVQGRPLHRIIVDDPAFPSTKKTILMLVRQHGDEYGSSYVLEGILADLLVSRRAAASQPLSPSNLPLVDGFMPAREQLLRFRWIIYPLVNPDGAVLNQRYNANGIDLNRDWDRAGCRTGQQAETLAIQCDIESLEALWGIDIAGDHHGWGLSNHGGYRYSPGVGVSFAPTPAYQEARKDTTLITRHDPTQWNWQENGAVTGMARSELFLRFGFLIHTPEYNSVISTESEFRAKGVAWGYAMVDALEAVRFSNRAGRLVRAASIGSAVHLTVDDDDENLAPNMLETVQVTVQDQTTGDLETFTLFETGPDTGVFRTEVGILLSAQNAVSGDGVLQTTVGARCVARYRDDDYPRDASRSTLDVL